MRAGASSDQNGNGKLIKNSVASNLLRIARNPNNRWTTTGTVSGKILNAISNLFPFAIEMVQS